MICWQKDRPNSIKKPRLSHRLITIEHMFSPQPIPINYRATELIRQISHDPPIRDRSTPPPLQIEKISSASAKKKKFGPKKSKTVKKGSGKKWIPFWSVDLKPLSWRNTLKSLPLCKGGVFWKSEFEKEGTLILNLDISSPLYIYFAYIYQIHRTPLLKMIF